jgi:hypothetical protein
VDMVRPKAVEVTWLDSHGTHKAWNSLDEVLQTGIVACECRTVGYLLKLDKQLVIVAQSLSDDEVGSPLTIPRGSVQRIRRLR